MDSFQTTTSELLAPARPKVAIPVFVALKSPHKNLPITPKTQPEIKRKRKSAPKSRGGCKTCRIRHEKCDQLKPACTKCKNTGRKCDFLSLPVSPSTTQSSVSTPSQSSSSLVSRKSFSPTPSSPLSSFFLEERDGHFYQYFIHAASTGFFNSYESPIWHLILQVSHSSETIRSATLANSILHNLHPYITADPTNLDYIPIYKSALIHYANAVNSLKQKLDKLEGEPDLATWEISILASFLFTSFEVLLGNEHGAHLQNINGFNMTKAALSVHRKNPKQVDLPGNLKTLTFGMNRRDMQGSTFGYGWTTQALLPPNVPDVFLNWGDAVHALETILPNILGLIRLNSDTDPCRNWSWKISESVRVQIENFQEMLEDWLKAFRKWVAFHAMMLSTSEGAGLTAKQERQERIMHDTLMIQYWNAYIWIHTPFSKTQLVFDDYLEQFTAIVDLAEGILELNPEKATTYSSEMEIIQPLFYVVQKCRNGFLRRRAIGLLMRSGREGVWDGICVGAAGQLIVEIEEEAGEGVWVEDRFRLRALHIHANRVERKLMIKGRRYEEDGEEVWAGRTMCWGDSLRVAEGEGVYGDGDQQWHWGFLFG